MKRAFAFLLVSIFGFTMLVGCGKNGNGGSQPSSGSTTPPASAGPESASGDTSTASEVEATGADEGERIRLEISNEDTEKGYLSAICPADWYDHSDGEYLFFSESETPADYAKPYIRLGYAPTATSTGGSGEDISFEMGSKNWDGLFNSDYNTYNVTHQLDGGGGLSVMSMGVGPEDEIFKMVVESIWVEF
ncbi:hypothetical protein LJC64_01735 [Ruminococcaceae bacterium OttesenSCG-928-A11]|nr:hypothetical protein [Ruminococcaceae bacterium OttesenSCG-928-A11]